MRVTLKRQKRSKGDGIYNLEIKDLLWVDVQRLIRTLAAPGWLYLATEIDKAATASDLEPES